MNAEAILSLQQIDSAIDAVNNKRPRLPEVAAHKAATDALGALRAQIAAAEQRLAAAAAAIEAAETAAEELTSKRARLEGQLKTVIAPREAEALMHEIAIINARRGRIDDEELAALDEQGAADEELKARRGELPASESMMAAASAELDRATAELDAEAAVLADRRAVAVATFDADEVTRYEQVRKQFGGVGVAKLEGSHCSGCHMELSPAEIDGVKSVAAGDVSECPQCGRMLVR